MSHYNTQLHDVSHVDTNSKIAFISADFNSEFVNQQEEITANFLWENGFKNITKYRVPGALEIPAMLARLLEETDYDLVYCFGVVVRGETTHYDIVAGESARAIMDLSLVFSGTAIINGISTCENEDQVKARINDHIAMSGLNLLSSITKI